MDVWCYPDHYLHLFYIYLHKTILSVSLHFSTPPEIKDLTPKHFCCAGSTVVIYSYPNGKIALLAEHGLFSKLNIFQCFTEYTQLLIKLKVLQ